MPRIFISYRREDSSADVQHLLDVLKTHLPVEAIFFDRVSLKPGDDFRQEIYRALQDADILLIIIGSKWADSFNERAQLNPENNEDHVRIEIETAIRYGKIVVPLVLEDTAFPAEKLIPKTISGLINKNAIRYFYGDPKSEGELLDSVKYALKKSLDIRVKRIGESIGVMPAALSFGLDSLKFAYKNSGGVDLEAEDIWDGLIALAKEEFGIKWNKKLHKLGIRCSEDLGLIIYSLVLGGVLNKGDSDCPSDFWGIGTIEI